MKYLFKKETIFATLSVFVVLGLFILIPLNLLLLDPIKFALTDINFNDLSFSKLKTHRVNNIDDSIIIVNIAEAGRKDISKLLNQMSSYNTKVIGLDMLFEKPEQPATDYELAKAIQKIPNLVLSDSLEGDNEKLYHYNFFNTYCKHSGYINFVGEDRSAVRYFLPFETWKDSVKPSFASAVSQLADKEKYDKLEKRNNQSELINYKRLSDQYFIIDYSDILNNKTDIDFFKNKIVLIGYLNDNSADVKDKHFTPLNNKFVGRSLPDMNGVVIEANIISMIMDSDYITEVPSWMNWVIAIFLNWLFISVAVKYYIEHHLWYYTITRAIQFILAFLFVYVGIIIMHSFRVSINFNPTLFATILSVDVLYFYEAFAKWRHRKYAVHTIFNKAQHK